MKEFLKKYAHEFTCKEWKDGFVLFTPIMYQGADYTFSFFQKDGRGRYEVKIFSA